MEERTQLSQTAFSELVTVIAILKANGYLEDSLGAQVETNYVGSMNNSG